MSVHFTSGSVQYLTRTASAPNYNAAYTMLGWVRFDTLTATMYVMEIGGAAAGSDYDSVHWLLSSTFLGLRVSIAGTPTTTTTETVAADTWYCFAIRRVSATQLELWVGTTPASLALGPTITTDVSGRGASTQMRLGVVGTTTGPFNGDLAAVKCWTVALTESEMKAELAYFPAVRTADLWGEWWLQSHTDLTDTSGNSRNWTAQNGPLTTETDPPGVSETLGQTILPTATVAAGNWSVSGAATHHEALADESASSYVQSTANPVGTDILKLALTDIDDPGAGDVTFDIDAEQV